MSLRPAMPRDRQRGNVATIFALLLPALIGFAAFVVDLGHGWQVKNQVQNAVDAAALAAVRDLDGTSTKETTAINSAISWAAYNQANNANVSLASSNVTLGTWNFGTRTFTAASGATAAYQINAVQVTSPTLSVSTWFAPVIGVNSESVSATAIAVGGSPDAACGWPIAVPDCSLIDSSGNIQCNSTLTFNNSTTDNVGFVTFNGSSVNTPNIDCGFATALGITSYTKNGCDPSSKCNSSTTSNTVNVSNGNNLLTATAVTWINANAPIQATLPVLYSGGLSSSQCGKGFQFNGTQTVVGYVTMTITGATSQPNRTITATINCTATSATPPGGSGSGGFYGYKSTDVYLVK